MDLSLAPADGTMDPLLRALHQQRLRQLRKLQQLQSQTLLNAERHAALDAKSQREQQRREEQEAQRREERAARAQQAEYAERRRQENLAAKKEQEARMQELMQAKLKRASEQAAAVHQQRQVQLRLQQNTKAATKQATIQTIRERAELAAEEKRRHYLVKSWLVDDKIRKIQEERTAAEAAKKEEERRREAMHKLHLSRAELDEQERREYFKRQQEMKEQELADRREELEEIRRMKAREANLREALARQRREEATRRDQERQEQMRQRTQRKMARAEAVEQQKAATKQALEQLRCEIARQEDDFKQALQAMQRSGKYPLGGEVAELQALLTRSPAASPVLLSYYSRGSSSLSNSRPSQQRPPRSGSLSRPGSRAQGGSVGTLQPARQAAASKCSSGSDAYHVLDSDIESPALYRLAGSPNGTSSTASPRIHAYHGSSPEEQMVTAAPGCGRTTGSATREDAAASSALHGLHHPQLEGPAHQHVRNGSNAGSLHTNMGPEQGTSTTAAHHETYTVDAIGACDQEDGRNKVEASQLQPREQLQALLQAEVHREAERERLIAESQDAGDRQRLLKIFMKEREQSKAAIKALAQSLGMG